MKPLNISNNLTINKFIFYAGCVGIAVFIATRPQYYSLMRNTSGSLPWKYWIVDHSKTNSFQRGMFISYVSEDVYHPDEVFIKQIAGVKGDIVNFRHGDIFVNNQRIGFVESHGITIKGPLNPITTSSLVIPDKCYFVRGYESTSYDSRYSQEGLVCEYKNKIIGRVHYVPGIYVK